MNTRPLMFLSVPGLRPRDVSPEVTPTLFAWADGGVRARLVPTFPCVTSPVQASMWTGETAERHGVVSNGFYHRDRREVEFWVARNSVIQGKQVWDVLRERGISSAVWHAQNIKDCAADFIVTPAPIHEDDGSTRLWCYSKPDGLYQQLVDELGHFPLQHYWGPLSNIASTRWIIEAAAWLAQWHAPRFHWVYIPHLDYASQKFGPDSERARDALAEFDAELARLSGSIAQTPAGKEVIYIVAGEYAMTDVTGVVYPNRVLREAGLVTIDEYAGREQLRVGESRAFAMVDHQLAHVFINHNDANVRRETAARVADLFRRQSGIAGVYVGEDRNKIGLNHPRSGDVVLVSDDAHWFAYYWWSDDALAPPFARTVDIHRKPGYDPVELFVDSPSGGIPLDATLVRGSHGASATADQQKTALVCSARTPIVEEGAEYRDTDLKRICVELLTVDM